jgi:tetratricopeptide (TPR) repeat protein
MIDPSLAVCDPQVVERVLDLLRRWGWEAAGVRLQHEIQATTDPGQRAELEMLTGWVTAERGGHEEAEALFDAAGVRPELKAWALVGRAFVAYRGRRHDRAQQSLGLAARCGCESDHVLRATLHHLHGVLAYAQGRADDALKRLYAALEALGLDHFGSGRILDSLGMVYGSLNDFATAVLFYQRAEESKRHASEAHSGLGDLAGLALTYGVLLGPAKQERQAPCARNAVERGGG